jgi:hypothetical protein
MARGRAGVRNGYFQLETTTRREPSSQRLRALTPHAYVRIFFHITCQHLPVERKH